MANSFLRSTRVTGQMFRPPWNGAEYPKQLNQNIPFDKVLEDGAVQGKNDFRKIGYGGPCPPGGIHRYFFRIYALDKKLVLNPGATKGELLHAMEGYMLAEGKLM